MAFVAMFLLSLSILHSSTVQSTGLPSADLTTVDGPALPTVMLICPAGDGAALSDVAAVLGVTVRDGSGMPLGYMSPNDFWMVGCSSGLTLHNGGNSSRADAMTDINGYTTISGTIAGGGSDAGLHVVVRGVVINQPAGEALCLPIRVASPDINGDLRVDLIDFSLFASYYNQLPAAPLADFNGDGVVDLIDFVSFAGHYLHYS